MTNFARFTCTSLAACAFALSSLAACDGESETTQEPNVRVEAELQRVLDEAVQHSEALLPGAIAYYRNPRYRAWSGGAGLGDLDAETPIQPDDQIRAGSVAKTFLATVTLQLVEEGTLSLDQRLPELLPDSVTDRVKNADEITLLMLLNHTSGIPNWVSDEVDLMVAQNPARIWTDDDALDLIAAQPALFPPGTSFEYSNSNYNLIGMVLDRIGQGSWREQVRARVIEPLRLTSTYLPEPGDPSMPNAYAHGYHEVDGKPMDLSLVDPSMAGASGGSAMITTVQDLARFLDALLDGRLFDRKATLKAMTTMMEVPHESGFPYGYGLGLETYEIDGIKVIGHAGSTGGYGVMMYEHPESGAILVTAVNTTDLFVNALDVFIPALKVIAADR